MEGFCQGINFFDSIGLFTWHSAGVQEKGTVFFYRHIAPLEQQGFGQGNPAPTHKDESYTPTNG